MLLRSDNLKSDNKNEKVFMKVNHLNKPKTFSRLRTRKQPLTHPRNTNFSRINNISKSKNLPIAKGSRTSHLSTCCRIRRTSRWIQKLLCGNRRRARSRPSPSRITSALTASLRLSSPSWASTFLSTRTSTDRVLLVKVRPESSRTLSS